MVQKLTEALDLEGFVRSEADQYVLLRKDCVNFVYDYDMIATSKGGKVLNDLVQNSKAKKYILTDEGPLIKYLGVDAKEIEGGGCEPKQSFLIQRIIDFLGMEGDSVHNAKPTLATRPLMHNDLEGKERINSWNYRKVLGLLTYL